MVLHIAFDGIDGVGKTTQVQKLAEYLAINGYKVASTKQPANNDVIDILNNYNLSNHEIALLMAFDRSYTYYSINWDKYDIIIWDRSILSSYAYNTDNQTPKTFIKQINRYFPEMDLYIIIEHDQLLAEPDYTTNNTTIISKYHELSENHKNTVKITYQENQEEEMLEEIINQIFNHLPKCQWCGRLFTPTQKHKKYCCEKCSKYSLEDQYRINNRNYYHRYKDVMSERQKGGLGSKGANLHGTADPNPILELEKVRKGKKALGLKPIK